MKKTFFILIIFSLCYNISYASDIPNYYANEKPKELTSEKVISDVQEIKSKMDTTISTGKEAVDIISNTIKKHGLKRAIQIHSSVFLPLFVFGILFLLYLRKRRK